MKTISLKNWKDPIFILGLLLVVTGFNLTLFSWLGICTEACGEVHSYRFLGQPFELLGFLFFGSVGLIHILTLWYPQLFSLEFFLTSGALGGEVAFIYIQKYTIGQWCPICLSIALTVGLFWSVLLISFFLSNRGNFMKFRFIYPSSFIIFLMALTFSLFAVDKPVASFVDGNNHQSPAFGTNDSNIEVYIVTDWFCPACRAIEPTIERMAPQVMKSARLFFVDMDIHPESLNFVPYNLSFMVNNKSNYFEIRKALHKLAINTKKPTTAQVEEAVGSLGVKYTQLDFTDIDSGRRFFEGVTKNFKVTQTPTVVVANRKKLNAKKFVGGEITETNILKAISDLQ
jgi:uncharacterized membrane protein